MYCTPLYSGFCISVDLLHVAGPGLGRSNLMDGPNKRGLGRSNLLRPLVRVASGRRHEFSSWQRGRAPDRIVRAGAPDRRWRELTVAYGLERLGAMWHRVGAGDGGGHLHGDFTQDPVRRFERRQRQPRRRRWRPTPWRLHIRSCSTLRAATAAADAATEEANSMAT